MEHTENMDQPCHQEHLTSLAQDLTQWEVVALALGLKESEVEEVEECGKNLPEKKVRMLLKWKSKFNVGATYQRLCDCLSSLKRNDLADKVKELSTTPLRCVSELAKSLKTFYETNDVKMRRSFVFIETDARTVPKRFEFFKLVIVEGEIADMDGESSRTLPMKSRMKEVGVKRKPIKLENIFKDGSDSKTILIEGAPGSGKSTLLWHMCHLWRSGDLFKEFNYVIHVQLRDPGKQKAKIIADLIPCSTKLANCIWEEIEDVEGKGVLFLLDGWDELPPHLQGESLINDILNRSDKSGIQFSSVVVTSRHTSSDELLNAKTSHLEIVGFTEDEAKKCISSLLSDNPDSIPCLIEKLEVSPSLMCCCYLPLNVVIIVHVFLIMGHKLPSTMLEILQALICNCIWRHTKRHYPECRVKCIRSLNEIPPCVEKAFQHLCGLAFEGLKIGKLVFTEEEIGQECDKLSLLQEAMCFEVAGTSMRYNFLHLTIQELLAAVHMSKMPVEYQVSTFCEVYPQEQFSTVLQLYAGITSFKHPKIVEAFYGILKNSRNLREWDKSHTYQQFSFDPNKARSDLRDCVKNKAEHRGEVCQFSIWCTCCIVVYNCVSSVQNYQRYGREFLLASNCLYETKQVDIYKRFDRETFKIANIPFTPYDCFALGHLISKVALETFVVDIWNCCLHELNVIYLTKGLIMNLPRESILPVSKCISIVGPETDAKCAKILSEILQYKYQVYHDCCDMRADGLTFYLQSIMKSDPQLMERIIIHGSNVIVNDSNGPLLQNAIASRLHHLDLEDNPGVAGGVSYISQGVKCQSTVLFYLNLAGCNLTSSEAQLIAEGLKMNSSLLKINLSNNNIGGKGAESIAGALEQNTTLKILDLSLCHLTMDEMIILTEILSDIDSLKRLDLFVCDGDTFPNDGTLSIMPQLDLRLPTPRWRCVINKVQL